MHTSVACLLHGLQVRLRQGDGSYSLSHVDAVIDEMLGKDYLFGVTLPRIPARHALEAIGKLEPRVSVLDEEFDEIAVEVRRLLLRCVMLLSRV